jgi:hypothetical protein
MTPRHDTTPTTPVTRVTRGDTSTPIHTYTRARTR